MHNSWQNRALGKNEGRGSGGEVKAAQALSGPGTDWNGDGGASKRVGWTKLKTPSLRGTRGPWVTSPKAWEEQNLCDGDGKIVARNRPIPAPDRFRVEKPIHVNSLHVSSIGRGGADQGGGSARGELVINPLLL